MTSTLPILVQGGEKEFSIVMRNLLTWYTPYDSSGHKFEVRYKAILCGKDHYLRTHAPQDSLKPLTSLKLPSTSSAVLLEENKS